MEILIVILLIILICIELVNKVEIKPRKKGEKIIEVIEEDIDKRSFDNLMNYTVEQAINSKRGDS